MKKLFLLLVAVLMVGLCASAQTRTVSGTVLDANTEEPLIGVSVIPAGQLKGVASDMDGNFSIVVPTSVSHLTVSYIGYKTQSVAITDGHLLVKLTVGDNVLDEVIAVAYGQAKRSEYTGSAGVVKAEQLEDALVSNVTSALTGYIPGVQTNSSYGQPGSAPSISIRGTGSINADDSPLYVVDGVPFPTSDISSISPQDVESMVVLKDAASTALYGARGANGVILITTKRGKEGAARITVDARWGTNSRAIPNYDVISDQRQYMETTYQSMYNNQVLKGSTPVQANAYANNQLWNWYGYQTWTVPEGQYIFSQDGKFNPNATPGYSDGRYYYLADDWAEEGLINGLRQEYNVSITGGTQRLQYYISGSYLNDEGIIKGSHFNRLTTRASVDYQAKDWLKIGSQLSYIYADQAAPGDQTLDASTSSGNVFYFANGMAPIYPVYIRNADGSIMWNEFYNNPVYDYGDGKDYGNGRTGVGRVPNGNPIGQLLYNTEAYLMDILNAKWYATITPVKGLTITENVAYYVDNTRIRYIANGLYGQFADMGGQAIQQSNRLRTITLQTLVNYNITIADLHDLYFLAGYESEDYADESVYASGLNLYQPLNPFVDNTIDEVTGGGSYGELAHRGFFFQGKYTYDGRYYVMGSIRRDGSSRFAPEHRWGTFWSLSAGWDISKEKFMADFRSNIDILKLKASFGQTGNDKVGGSIAYLDFYSMTGADGVFSDGVLSSKGNYDLTWEKSNSFNVGVDFSFWKGKLAGTVEYFTRQTNDMLFYLPVNPSLGYSSIPSNVGSLRNSGVEFDVNYNIFNNQDFQWDVFANATLLKNKVVSLDPSILNEEGIWERSTYIHTRIGHSLYELYLPQYAGVDPKTGYAQYWALNEETGEEYATPDWTEARLTNSKFTGDISAKVFGGFGTRLNFRGFELSLAFSYQLGGKLMDSGYQDLMGSGTTVGAWHKDILNATIPSDVAGDAAKVTDIPALNMAPGQYDYAAATSDRFLISSDYLALNNVSLGYTFPAKWTSKLGLEGLRIYGAAENLALWSARKGLDPRQNATSSSNFTYSPIRAISGGITVNF